MSENQRKKCSFGRLNTDVTDKNLLVREEEFEILKLAAGIRDFVGITVESLAVLMLGTSLVVSEHTDSVLHSKNLVIDTSIISVLITKIVETLAKFSD